MKIIVSDMPGRGSLRPKEVVELARIADQVGIDRVGVTDSPFRPELIPLMAACLAVTERIQVESLLSTPFRRPPDVTASTWATMSEVSDGRAILGLGRGADDNWLWIEPWKLGPRPALKGIAQLVEICQQMWSGQVPSTEGPWAVTGKALEYPVEYKIPILIGGRGPAILGLAAKVADIVHLAVPFRGVDFMRRNIEYVQDRAAAASRQPGSYEIEVTIATSISRDRAHARRAAKRAAAGGLGALAGAEWAGPGSGPLQVDDFAVEERVLEAVLGSPQTDTRAHGDGTGRWARAPLTDPVEELIDDHLIDAFVVAGAPTEVQEQLIELREALPANVSFRLKPPPFTGPDAFTNARAQVELIGLIADGLRD